MADAGSAVESFGGFTRYVDDSGGGDDAGGGGGGDDAGSGGGGDDAGDVAYRRAEAACVAVRKAGAYVRLLERSWRLDRDSAVAAARPRLVAATEHLAGAEAAALAAFAGRAGGPCAYTREGELLIDVLADVALAGFAAELAPARFLCNETFEIREPGAVAYVLRNALEAQCGATAARAARREAGGATQLTLAAGRGDDARVRMLIALGALGQWNLSTSGPAALLAACGARQRRAVEALLAVPGRAVDVNCGALVSSLPDTDLARFLLSRGAHVGNALSYIFRGQPASVMRISTLRLLLDHGANANEQDGEGDTALLHLLKNCSRHGDEQAECAAMRLLLDHGASPNIITKDGLTPLRLAYINGLPDAAVLLRERGAIGPQQRGPGGAGVGGIGVDVGAGVGIGVGNRRQNIELRKLLRRSRPIENPNVSILSKALNRAAFPGLLALTMCLCSADCRDTGPG